ncbi:acyl carrier protein [Paenibacillus sp. NPDC055715]
MSKDEIFQLMKVKIIELIPEISEELIRPEESLKQLGANSIDRMEVIVSTMQDLKIKVPLLETTQALNIGDLVDLFNKYKQEKSLL